MPQGQFGEIRAWNDFTFAGGVVAGAPSTLYTSLGGGWGLIGVEEGVLALIIDEPGGVLDILTDTADNDNSALIAGAFKPADGGMEMEVRLKITDSVATTRAAVFVGFTETLAHDTPVMPAETATVTTTYNGSGGMVGFVFDSDSTALVWRFVAGDGGAALATVAGPASTVAEGTVGGAVGITANTLTAAGATGLIADNWYVIRVEVGTDGKASGYISNTAGDTHAKLVGRNTAALGTGDSFHACALIENRSGANERIEVDYAYARGWRDWAV